MPGSGSPGWGSLSPRPWDLPLRGRASGGARGGRWILAPRGKVDFPLGSWSAEQAGGLRGAHAAAASGQTRPWGAVAGRPPAASGWGVRAPRLCPALCPSRAHCTVYQTLPGCPDENVEPSSELRTRAPGFRPCAAWAALPGCGVSVGALLGSPHASPRVPAAPRWRHLGRRLIHLESVVRVRLKLTLERGSPRAR